MRPAPSCGKGWRSRPSGPFGAQFSRRKWPVAGALGSDDCVALPVAANLAFCGFFASPADMSGLGQLGSGGPPGPVSPGPAGISPCGNEGRPAGLSSRCRSSRKRFGRRRPAGRNSPATSRRPVPATIWQLRSSRPKAAPTSRRA